MESDLYFYHARSGDKVCIVDDLLETIKLDVIEAIYIPEKEPWLRYLHLAKSKMILDERDKYIIYPAKEATKLSQVLSIMEDKNGDWLKRLAGLMSKTGKTPPYIPPPAHRVTA
jgi:hypothetical protein